MKKIFVLLTLLILFACQSKPDYREFSAMETMGQIQNDFAILVDIRSEPEEMAQPAHHIPADDIIKNTPKWRNFLEQKTGTRTIVFYGDNKEEAIKICKSVNKKTGYLMSYEEWTANGLPAKKSK